MAAPQGQIFISYRHVEPDEGLARALARVLRERGHPVFIDQQILVGTRWVEEIERQLRASAFFVVLLSAESIRSDMVRQEVKLAHELELEDQMRILPIRVDFAGVLPYDLGSFLNPIQYAVWERGAGFEGICQQIVAAVESAAELPHLSTEITQELVLRLPAGVEAPGAGAAPLPAADPRVVLETGTVRPGSPFYVRRAADSQMERVLGRDRGETLVIKGSRQNGKSSLLARAHALCLERGRQAVYLDLQTLDAAQLASLDSVMRALAARIARELRTEVKPKEVWDEDLGAKESFAEFLELAVLARAEEPVLLALDEVDLLFERTYRNDFFAAVRAWHNSRATKPIWDRLHLAIAHATEPALWIDDLRQSPFNVGERLSLDGFETAEIAELDARHGRSLGHPGQIEELRRFLGGHPFLVRQALYVLATDRCSLAELRRVALEDRGPFGDHLRQRLWALHRPESRAVAAALRDVLNRGECAEEMAFQRLQAAGLVEGEGRRSARVRSELYRDYFHRHL